jgi:hypothetical protein
MREPSLGIRIWLMRENFLRGFMWNHNRKSRATAKPTDSLNLTTVSFCDCFYNRQSQISSFRTMAVICFSLGEVFKNPLLLGKNNARLCGDAPRNGLYLYLEQSQGKRYAFALYAKWHSEPSSELDCFHGSTFLTSRLRNVFTLRLSGTCCQPPNK